MWDTNQPSDARGEQLEDWVIAHSASVLNDGTATFLNRATGGLSSPDEKAHRLPIDHPRRQVLVAPSRHRLKRPSWRSAAQASTSHLPTELAHRAPIDSPFSCPWEDSSIWSVLADNMAPPGFQDDTTLYLSFIRHLNVRFITYTYGSATAGTPTVVALEWW